MEKPTGNVRKETIAVSDTIRQDRIGTLHMEIHQKKAGLDHGVCLIISVSDFQILISQFLFDILLFTIVFNL